MCHAVRTDQKQVLRSLRSHQDDKCHLIATRANAGFTGAGGAQPDTRSQWRDITSVSPRSAKSRWILGSAARCAFARWSSANSKYVTLTRPHVSAASAPCPAGRPIAIASDLSFPPARILVERSGLCEDDDRVFCHAAQTISES